MSSWADRHPAAVTTAGLFSLTLMCMMFSEHPVAAFTVTAVSAVGAGVWLLDRERDRRAATAARADAANRELMRVSLLAGQPAEPGTVSALPEFGIPRLLQRPIRRRTIAENHVMNRYPTTPLRTHTQPIQ